MPMLDTNAQPAAGFNRFALTVAKLQYLSTGLSIVPLDESDGTLWFIGRVATTVGNATTYGYNILYSVPCTSVLKDAGGNMYADVPQYVNVKSPDFLYVVAPPGEDAESVVSKLPTNRRI